MSFKRLLKIKDEKLRNQYLSEILTDREKKMVKNMLKSIEMTQKGLSNRKITDALGMGHDNIKNWILRAEKAIEECEENFWEHAEHQDYLYIEFKMSFSQAKALYQAKLLGHIEDQAEGLFSYDSKGNVDGMINKPDWKAAKWLLEKNDKEEFGDVQDININHGGSGGGTGGAIVIPVLGTSVSEEELNKMLADSQNDLIKQIDSKKENK